MKKNRKAFSFLFILFQFSLFALPVSEMAQESRIENGLTIFTYEDFSNPQIRVELNVRSGFSSQTVQDAGFFTLLSNLIQKSSRLSFDSVTVNSESTRFILNISPSRLEEVLMELSDSVFNPVYSDALLSSEAAKLKREVLLMAEDGGTMMNAGIDSRVFSAEPWRNDSGIFPALFSKLTDNEIRKTLNDIQENFFVPGNAALFISGNIKKENVIGIAEDSFGRFYSSRKVVSRPLLVSDKGQRKFVLHGKDFSDELTQIVVQYEKLSPEENALASAVYNDDYSIMKKALIELEELNIPGAEYVNVAAAGKSGSSRLIIQSLLQNVKNISPASQTNKFLETVKNESEISYEDFSRAVTKLNTSYNRMISDSSAYMNALSDQWSMEPYEEGNQSPAEKMEMRRERYSNVSVDRIHESLTEDEPFVFVIVNTKVFSKYKKDFTEAGFEEINGKNASWYTDSLYKNVKSLMELSRLAEGTRKEVPSSADYVENFLKGNRDSVTSETLPNGIPLYIKYNDKTKGVTILISVAGGNLRTANDHGFEEVMINILTMNILRQIKQKQFDGLVLNDFEIYSETGMKSSHIIIECEEEDFYSIVSAVSRSLIMDEVIPSDADRIVQGRKTRKRLENGSTINQLYSAAVKAVLPKTPYEKIFETQNEILEKTSYEKILQNYPSLLDASRYSIIVSGNMDPESIAPVVEDCFSVLKKQKKSEKKVQPGQIKKFQKGKEQKVKLVHTFLTDVPAKDAGPMPAVLIPTKSFADPVLYCASVPEGNTEIVTAINAVLPYLQEELIKAASEKMYLYNCKVSCAKATENIPMITVSFSSVEKTSACDSLYKSVLQNLVDALSNTGTSGKTVNEIISCYVASEFSEAYKNTGSAVLIEDSLLQTDSVKDPLFYLERYKKVHELTAEKFLEAVSDYLDFDCLFRLYSSESKK